VLVGRRVTLRTVRPADLEVLFALSDDVRHAGPFYPLEMRQETGWWDDEFGVLLIFDPEDVILGQIVIFRPAAYQNALELGYRLFRPGERGKGVMSEAVSIAVAFLFEARRVERIQATILPGNEASRRVLQKCGFSFEGVMRAAMFHRGQATDLHLHSILGAEARPLCELLAG